MRNLRIVFMGTPSFSVGVLKKLIENHLEVVGVITAPDKPAGRGKKVTPSAVKEYALSQQLPILQPTHLKEEAFLGELKSLEANLFIVVAFRMLPKVVWQMPSYGTFNLHASLLPQYRGAAPINWAIIHGEKETGVTTFFIDEAIDTGAIIASEKIAIEDRETAGSLHDKLMDLGSDLVVKTVGMIQHDTVKPFRQPQEGLYREAPKLTAENTQIDWNTSVETLDRFIRGLSPYPTAWTQLPQQDGFQKIKIFAASPVKEKNKKDPGSIEASKKEIKVFAKDGYLLIEELQFPGKRKMTAKELLNGFQFENGAQFV